MHAVDTQSLTTERAYWAEYLDEAARCAVSLPLKGKRPKRAPEFDTRDGFVLGEDSAARLARITKKDPLLQYAFMAAVVNICLYFTNGCRPAISLGSPSYRGDAGESNALPLVNTLDPDADFESFLKRVYRHLKDAYAAQSYPHEAMLQDAGRVGGKRVERLFAVALTAKELHGPLPELPLDLRIDVRTGERLQARLHYSRRLFTADTVSRFAGHLQTVFEQVLDNSKIKLRDIELLTEAERAAIDAWGFNPQTLSGSDSSLLDAYLRQVDAIPGATAVIHDGRELSYADFDRRVNQLSHYLRRDVGVAGHPAAGNVVVGLCLSRGADQVAAVIAVLKAGAVCLPLAADDPPERLAYILRQANPVCVLADDGTAKQLPGGFPVIDIQAESAPIDTQPASPPSIMRDAGSLAYILYTSGSTGRPKGVAMGDGPLINLTTWHLSGELGAPARTLQFAAMTFDVSFQEILTTLSSGGTLILPDETQRRNSQALLRLLKAMAVERAFLPVVALKSLALAACNDDDYPYSLRDVITAGEQLRIDEEVADFFSRCRDCRLHNHYGPTETHVVTACTLDGEPAHWPPLPPIGRPVANTRIRILDTHGHRVPVGAPGEIYLGGACLAQGYLGQPALTAESFIPDLFSVDGSGRLYRTGDLGYWREDGQIDYLGRRDFQVKIRGYRVELGEIEHVLASHPQVDQAAVIVDDDGQIPRLRAFVAASRDNIVDIDALNRHLTEHLPAYMLPSGIAVLPQLPLTRSGKLDRRELKRLAPPENTPLANVAYRAPRTQLEEQLTAIWQQVLGLERVGVNDNFFSLGGHSLMITQIMSWIRDRLNVNLEAHVLFEATTVAELGKRIESLTADTDVQIADLAAELAGDEQALALLERLESISEE